IYEKNITSKTKLILMSHMINLTGQFLPVKKVVNMARKKGIPVIVDGAHSFGHGEFTIKDLDCDYFATSLHKWLLAPMGTGMLYVRKDKIKGLWPMTPASESQDDDIRKFEEIGTHPAGNILAITEAITFHNGIGAKRKEERLRYLFRRWADRLVKHENIKLHTSLNPKYSCGLANVEVVGVDSNKIGGYLWNKHRMIVTPIKHDEFEGLRITPNIYTTLDEVDLFADEMEMIAKNGLPNS
ncbi:MAG: aminotransferase class V-fold PLP-dependent enzyme, partial [Calditrichaeota bacterium]|nr:aminotransferase class V-fold PLP-dependent enzyme [Calditrichota bacterium]